MFGKKKIIFIALGAVFIVIIASLVYVIFQLQNSKELSDEEKALKLLEIEKENDVLIKNIGKLVELPLNELPTIATVSDKNKLNKQLFFNKVDNGDKVLIYKENKMAVIYRPSSNKIVNFATGINVVDRGTVLEDVAGATSAPTPIEIRPTLRRVQNDEVTPTKASEAITPTP